MMMSRHPNELYGRERSIGTHTTPDGRAVQFIPIPSQQRVTAMHEGIQIGCIDYIDTGSTRTITHTEVTPKFQGTGTASALVEFALQRATAEGMLVFPQCSYVRMWLQRHPEYQRIVEDAPRDGNNGLGDLPKGTQ